MSSLSRLFQPKDRSIAGVREIIYCSQADAFLFTASSWGRWDQNFQISAVFSLLANYMAEKIQMLIEGLCSELSYKYKNSSFPP